MSESTNQLDLFGHMVMGILVYINKQLLTKNF